MLKIDRVRGGLVVAADGLAIVPGDTTIAPGEPVEVMLLRDG